MRFINASTVVGVQNVKSTMTASKLVADKPLQQVRQLSLALNPIFFANIMLFTTGNKHTDSK